MTKGSGAPVDLAAIRATFEGGHGPAFWKSLDAVAETPAFRRFLEREYPAAAHLAKGPNRRGFFKIMAASLAMSGLAACDEVEDGRAYEVPYVRQPERVEPGQPLSYASTTLIDGFANGVLVTTVDGRPIKIEGNPQHPWSRGGTDIFGQASVLGLYDPMRSQIVRYLDRPSDWETFRNKMLGPIAQTRGDQGKGMRLLTGPVTSPSFVAQIQAMLKAMPQAKWHMVSPLGGAGLETASEAVFGERLDMRLHFDKARCIVAFDGDFLDAGGGQVGLSRRYAEARSASAAKGDLLTLHTAGATPTLTSAKADFHLAAEPGQLPKLLARLADAVTSASAEKGKDPASLWVARAAAALGAAKGAGIVVAGAMQPAAVHAAVHRLNATLGNLGQTVTFTEPVLPKAGSFADLVAAMDGGEVSLLLVLDANPVYEAPGAYRFADALAKVKTKIHAGAYVDETALRADWHLPLAHPLESWGDARAFDGTASLIQPTIRPLYEGRTLGEILSLLLDEDARDGMAIVKSYWQGTTDAAAYAPVWSKALTDGFLPNSAARARTATPKASPANTTPSAPAANPDTLTVLFRPDANLREGSHAANAWLQELPRPLTKIVWGNVVAVSPALAQRLSLTNGDLVEVAVEGARVEGAAWIQPGQAERTLTLTLGYGRNVPDQIFDLLGYDPNALRSKDSPFEAAGASLTKTGRTGVVATTQDHNTMEGHDFIRVARPGDKPQRGVAPERSLYGATRPLDDKNGGAAWAPRAWGMVIDTDTCIGCNACVVACQSENNIAVVGKEQVAMGRGMHWLRIDRYYSSAKMASGESVDQGDDGAPALMLDDPDTHFQPVPCMQCELAPCEVGCPVEATLHDHEGLNLMVYNRCVGTRACSGYCPYKVRHFNYLDYTGGQSPSVQARNNPDVTVRSRGVMEKCTYCVQRIADARITAGKADSGIPDGSVQTACQGACPTRAISFGDLADPTADVVAKRRDPRNYDLLGELNLRPRTTYLAERAPASANAIPGKAG
jgi:molybdopterin-containing oxidoreductase family iron-sulfur binding subunit